MLGKLVYYLCSWAWAGFPKIAMDEPCEVIQAASNDPT